MGYLNAAGRGDLVLVDDFSRPERERHLANKSVEARVDRTELRPLLARLAAARTLPEVVFHLGAHTDTAEADAEIFDRLNLRPSQQIWHFCAEHEIPLIYASSASTYGDGAHGYEDNHEVVPSLAPLNPYAQSKQDFDLWALRQNRRPPFWAGLKFFNVYGPNEGHKGRMASVVLHAFRQVRQTGKVKLFRSHRADVADGQQSRDFVYVRDVCDIMLWLWRHRPESGLYNVGTGGARPFADLASAVFAALEVPEAIEFVDTPIEIRDSYQYYTQANMAKLRNAGYAQAPTTLERGVREYVRAFLVPDATC